MILSCTKILKFVVENVIYVDFEGLMEIEIA